MHVSDADQTHVLGVVASWSLAGWGAGVRLRYATGMPRTPVVSALYDARSDAYQPVLGALATTRLPDFVQLDARLERRFALGRLTLDAYLDVQNVTARRNPEEIVYSSDYTRRGYLTGLPTVAVVGARLGF